MANDSPSTRPALEQKNASNSMRKASFTLQPEPSQDGDEDDSFSFSGSRPATPDIFVNDAKVIITPNPGTLPPELYETMMGPWRAAVRRRLVTLVEKESQTLARMQQAIRSPFLDNYFVYTSTLGTHTFFTASLPAFCFFGYPYMTRGLVLMLGLGIYVSSFLKDLFCSPRPFAPPVTRLTIGTHHLEYGFPSSHSTNSMSAALFIFEQVAYAFLAGKMSTIGFVASSLGLLWYLCSIVFGRLYTGMHSITDCIGGIVIGSTLWALHFFLQDWIEQWVTTAGWIVPITITLLGMVMIHKHPQPVDDCPCFEDAIAFVSVIMGIVIGWWLGAELGWSDSAFKLLMPGSAYETWKDVGTWWAFAALKMTVGILVIFAWRLAAKAALHAILPPTFRLLNRTFVLPHRRFYTPATDYKRVPAEGLHPIPSIIDLSAHAGVDAEQDLLVANASGVKEGIIRRPIGQARRVPSEGGHTDEKHGARLDPIDVQGDTVKHYDVDVITRVVVYFGIALLACFGLPVSFELLGWGVRSYSW